jgi:hypothetical protein
VLFATGSGADFISRIACGLVGRPNPEQAPYGAKDRVLGHIEGGWHLVHADSGC